DVLVVDEGHHPFLLAPHPRAVGVGVAPVPVVEELHPRGPGPRAQRVEVVLHLEQVAARGTAIDDLPETELPRTAVDALKPRVVAHHPSTIAVPGPPRALSPQAIGPGLPAPRTTSPERYCPPDRARSRRAGRHHRHSPPR